MRESNNISEISLRVKAVETQLSDKLKTLFGEKTPTPEVSAKAEAIRGKSGELTKKLNEKESSVWTAVKDELHRDLNALEGDFEHWVKYLDAHYKDKA